MNNHKTAITILNQADMLKAKMFLKNDVLNEPDFRVEQHQLQTMYHQVLVLDLEYALDKKIEQELWNVGFKHYITILQDIIKDKKNPRRSEAQPLLTSCLQSASGFYLSLLQELYSKFDIPGPLKRKNAVYGQIYPNMNSETLKSPRTSSCIYICQYCLVHLGDIARYMNKRREAESFYKQAIKASPTSGHPYNQLALLEATQGDKLSTVFHYVRGIAVKNPFPATATNLANTFSSLIDKQVNLIEVQTKMSVNDFIRLFLKVHGLLYTVTNLEEADSCIKSINATLTALVATQSFTADKLIKMTVINLYAYHHTVGEAKQNELTIEELIVKEHILDLISGSLSAFLLPVYTLKNDLSLLDYYALPAIKLIICWINKHPSILSENVFANKLQIWPSLCKLLNTLETLIKDSDYGKNVLDENIALDEDRELQGFLPLKETFMDLDFNSEALGEEVQKYERARRLIKFGLWLTDIEINKSRLIIRKEDSARGIMIFEPGCIQPDPTHKLLEEMKSIELNDKLIKGKASERRNGILKPQGSLEKAREERESLLISNTDQSNVSNFNTNDLTKLKRVKQNVALQSIFKKMEENKQVKFSHEATDKLIKSKTSMKPVNQPQVQNASNFMPTPPQAHSGRIHLPDSLPFDTVTKTNIAQGLNNQFSNSDTKKLHGMHIGQQPSQQQWFSNISNVSPHSNNMAENQKAFNNYPTDFNKSMYPTDRPIWNKEERPHVPTWWSNNTMQQNMLPSRNYNQNNLPIAQNYMRHQYDPYNFAFPRANNSVPQSPTTSMNVDMFKQNMQQVPSGMSNPFWNSTNKNMMENDNMPSFNNMNNMTVRQAMLNETRRMQNNTPTHIMYNEANTTNQPNTVNTPGYSLFNPSSWTPNLPGQICGRFNTENTTQVQQSLFSNNGSQSLKQLLEQQNQLSKDDT